jgi:two-component system chemotaxis sensor kinase CheA
MLDKTKYLDLFVEEAQEQLQNLNQIILELEKKGFDKENMNNAYRIVHTIKGSASVLGIEDIRDISHTMEDLFDILRGKETDLSDDVIQLLFKSFDLIDAMIQELSSDGTIKTNGEGIINQIKDLIKDADASSPKKDTEIEPEKDLNIQLSADQKEQVMEALTEGKSVYKLKATLNKKIRFKEGRVFQLLKLLSTKGYVIGSTPDTKEITEETTKIQILYATIENKKTLKTLATEITGIRNLTISTLDSTLQEDDINSDKLQQGPIDEKLNAANQQFGITKADTVRVKSKLLDQLLDLVGEIMITNIRINQIGIEIRHRGLKQVLKNSQRLIGELQDIVLRTRMVPVDHIFKRFPRMVRDIAKERDKEVNFEITGHDIEIDRSLLDDIGDALVHLLRNSVDHGTESEEERKSKDKKPICHIKLSAYREQSNIVITVEDDGRGINTGKIIEKAIENEIITHDELESMDKKDILQLAFQPGVSTAEKITDISGRGIGLDVVKTKIDALGGYVRLESEEGINTKFIIKLPPSMSIISAMLVEINNENYAIPLENLSETTKLSVKEIHEFAKSGMFRLREDVLPLLNIHAEFGGAIDSTNNDLPVIIVEKDESRAGLIVTRFIGQHEIVVKNLSKDLRNAQYFSGATILGDGNVALILDVGALL